MKITCSACKKLIGIQRPLSDDSVTSALCPECFQKEKEEASKPQPLPRPGEREDITLENGLKGYLTVADDASEPFLDDLMVSGKTFTCRKEQRDSFLDYLEMIEKDQVDITFLYSMATKITPPLKGRKKKELNKTEADKTKSIHCNCTVTAPKYYAIAIFDDKAERMGRFLDVISEGIAKEWLAGPQNARNKDDL